MQPRESDSPGARISARRRPKGERRPGRAVAASALTEHEAFEQIVEELELAGFGAPVMDAELEATARTLARMH